MSSESDEDEEVNSEFEETLNVLDSSAKLLSFFVEDLLSMAQVSNGTLKKNNTKFCVKAAIEELELMLLQKTEQREITVERVFAGFQEDDFQVVTDRQRLQQVVLAYLTNALQFTPRQGIVTITVCLKEVQGKKFLEVAVKDTGNGISEANQEKLFKFFGKMRGNDGMNQ